MIADRAILSCDNIPFPRNRRFVGRSAVLEELEQKLLVNKECQRVAVVGLGGIGKANANFSDMAGNRPCQKF